MKGFLLFHSLPRRRQSKLEIIVPKDSNLESSKGFIG